MTTTTTQPRRIPIGLILSAGIPVLVAVALQYYIGHRLLEDSGVPAVWAVVGWSVLFCLFATIPLGAFFARTEKRGWAVWLGWISHLWMGAFAMLLFVTFGLDLVRWLGGVVAPEVFSNRLEVGRWQAIATALLVTTGVTVGFFSARGTPRIERVRVPIPSLPKALSGYRIVQITDVHIGQTLGREFLRRVVTQVNALEADAIAITGDLVDGHVSALADEVAPLSQLVAKDGAFFVTGNHEYYYDGAGWERAIRAMGIRVLHNSHHVVERDGHALAIGGIPDHDGGRFGAPTRMAQTFEGAPSSAPRVLLAHQPRSLKHTEGHSISLQLSGHTHGGQFFPWMFFVRLQQPTVSGLFRTREGYVYTSRGTGYWGPPLRLGAPPEITELTLVPA